MTDDNPAMNAIAKAIMADDGEGIRTLHRQGFDLETRDKDGATALLWAVMTGMNNAAAALLDLGANPNTPRISNGVTPLEEAAGLGDEYMVLLLLKHGANPNQPDKEGETPLHAAVYSGLKTTKALVAAGADLTLKEHRGLTPEALAEREAAERLAFAQSPFVEVAAFLKTERETRAATAARDQAQQEKLARDLATLKTLAPKFKPKPKP